MVTVTNYSQKVGKDNTPYNVLELSGDMEIVFSKTTMRPYATCRRTTVPATFPEEMCKSLIGKQMPGTIKKVECEAYDYTLPETGTLISLTHRWQFVNEESDSPETAVFGTLANKKNTFIKK